LLTIGVVQTLSPPRFQQRAQKKLRGELRSQQRAKVINNRRAKAEACSAELLPGTAQLRIKMCSTEAVENRYIRNSTIALYADKKIIVL
jgi:hypothetical protein